MTKSESSKKSWEEWREEWGIIFQAAIHPVTITIFIIAVGLGYVAVTQTSNSWQVPGSQKQSRVLSAEGKAFTA